MNLSPSLDLLATDTAATSVGATARSETANFRWERAVSAGRADEYQDYVGTVSSHKNWKSEHKGYVRSYIQVAKDLPISAECFTSVNALAHLNEAMDDTFLLRIESIGHLFQPLLSTFAYDFWQRFYNSQNDLRKVCLPDEAEALRTEFVTQWNAQRLQARPMFATFLNEFGGDLKSLVNDDWPHILRDRLGLTHLSGTVDKPLPVALMRYSLNEVREARLATKKGAVASFTRPTVLDGEMSAAFIPAPLLPGGGSYGYTLDLANSGIPVSFTPELLTFPIDYQPTHIKALGFISKPHALQDGQALLEARNRHVQGLQTLSDCSDFGEVLV
ncbi:MAG: hypothetical protein CTY16_15410 [Methylobacter sp.]|nr:MAG: hypothetical protein CTY16_15410 [Methylobacter sp.]